MKDLHIGNKIQKVLHDKGITVTVFATRINKSRENIYSIFNRKTIDTGLLLTISEALDYDFFKLYIKPDKETQNLAEQNKMLKEMNELLRAQSANAGADSLKKMIGKLNDHLEGVIEKKKLNNLELTSSGVKVKKSAKKAEKTTGKVSKKKVK